MTRDEATTLVRELICCTTEYTKAVNSSRGHKTKGLAERKAAAAVLTALMGEKPTATELDRVCEL